MTQDNRAQRANKELASTPRARVRTLARCRADLEQQIRSSLATHMALTEPKDVRERMQDLRKRVGMKQHEVARALNVAPRTFQSWETAEVETDRANYEKIARWYTRRLKEKITADWILFGQDKAPSMSARSTPDLFGHLGNDKTQLDRIELKLDAILLHFEISAAETELAERRAEEADAAEDPQAA